MKKTILLLLLLSTLNPPLPIFAQGSLTPPGTPAPTMKSLDQIEARTPISSLPFTITNSGSYYLTATLTGSGTASGITIRTNLNDVTVDLNGFALVGGPNSALGITVPSFPATNIVIINGTVRNWLVGVDLPSSPLCRVERLQVLGNRFGGIGLGNDSIVRQCTVMNNGGTIALGTGFRGLIEDCIVSSNATSIAISVNGGSTVTRCTLQDNTGAGIIAGSSQCIITHCHLIGHPLDGIRVFNRNVVAENTVIGAGNTLGTNACIHATLDSNRIEANHVSWHQIGIRVDPGNNLIIRNSSYFNGTNYFISGGNQFGPVSGGSGVTNHPWANFSL